MIRCLAAACAAALLLLLAGCATPSGHPPAEVASSPWARFAQRPWFHQALPGKTHTVFRYESVDGRDAVAAYAASSASLLRQDLRVEPPDLGRLRFSWKVPALIADADLTRRDKADAVVRVVLVFDGDRDRLSARDAALSELLHVTTGEPLPYATLMYVWSTGRPADAVVRNPRTDRVRKLVLESGPARLDQWIDYERDIRADYERVFGEPPGALVGLAIMTDSDNTRSQARAWYGPLQLLPPTGR